jgi:hypothetical protein
VFDGLVLCDPALSVLTDEENGVLWCAQLLATNILLEHKPPVGLADGLLVKVPFLDSGFEHAQGGDEAAVVFEDMGHISQIMALDDVESLYVVLDIEPFLWTRLRIEGSLDCSSHGSDYDRLDGGGGGGDGP